MNREKISAIRSQFLPYIIASCVILMTLGVVWKVDQAEQLNIRHTHQKSITYQLSAAAAELDVALNTRLALLRGLAAYVTSNPSIKDEDFNRFVENLLADQTGFQNLQLAPDSVVVCVYPEEGNQALIGRDFSADVPPVEVAAQDQTAILEGPVDGMLILRLPIFTSGDYWGLIVAELDFETILAETGLRDGSSATEWTLRNEDGLVFFGNPALFSADSYAMRILVSVPGGSWEIGARPDGGWMSSSPARILLLSGGVLLALLLGVLSWFFAREPFRLREAVDRATAALRASENDYRMLMEQATDSITITDAEGNFLTVNSQASVLLGYTREELLKMNVYDITPLGERDQVSERMAALRRTKNKVFRRERVLMRKDGSSVPVEITAKQLDDGRMQAIMRDITERKVTEAALQRYAHRLEVLREIDQAILSAMSPEEIARETLSRLRHLTPSDNATVLLFDFPAEKISLLATYQQENSPAGTASELYKLKIFRAIVPLLQTTRYLLVEDILKKPNRLEFEDALLEKGIRSYLIVPLKIQNELIGVLSLERAAPSVVGEEYVTITYEVSAQLAVAIQQARLYEQVQHDTRELEQRVNERTAELNRTKEHTITILNNSSDAIILARASGFIEQTNPAFNAMFGYEENEEIFGRHLTDYVAPESVGILDQTLQWLAEEEQPQRIEIIAQRIDGTTFDGDLSLAPLTQYAEALYVVLSLRDISELKQVENQLKHINRLKTEFLSTAAHELRTPLTSIQGFSELLIERDLPEDRQHRYLAYINEQATQLGTILDDLLNISRLEAGRGIQIATEPVDMSKLIQVVILPFNESAPDHCLVIEGDVDLPPVTGDPMRLTQVLQNLVSNAIKYSPDGGKVYIRAQVRDEHLMVMVEDEGIGMTSEQQVHLFEKFYRADGSNTAIGGTGLGLAICKLIVELHGGEIWTESEYGVGSTFYFTVPLHHVSLAEEA